MAQGTYGGALGFRSNSPVSARSVAMRRPGEDQSRFHLVLRRSARRPGYCCAQPPGERTIRPAAGPGVWVPPAPPGPHNILQRARSAVTISVLALPVLPEDLEGAASAYSRMVCSIAYRASCPLTSASISDLSTNALSIGATSCASTTPPAHTASAPSSDHPSTKTERRLKRACSSSERRL